MKDQIHVTIADREIDDSLKSNLDTYSLKSRDLPLDINRIPGDPMEPQHVNEIFTAKCSANVVLHMEAFDFMLVYNILFLTANHLSNFSFKS